jgi:hypothetical protein
MATFKVTYTRGEPETVEADYYREMRNWIVFFDRLSDIQSQEKLRIKSTGISRVELVAGESTD